MVMDVTSGGYTCMYCGMYVMWGAQHQCQPVAPTYVYVDPTIGKLDRIIELLEEILEEIR
jgi:hypothetical protein